VGEKEIIVLKKLMVRRETNKKENEGNVCDMSVQTGRKLL
jgi:hypothetical protein